MRKVFRKIAVVGVVCLLGSVGMAYAHEGHDHGDHRHNGKAEKPPGGKGVVRATLSALAVQSDGPKVSGDGKWRFKWRPDLSKVPVEPEVLRKAHGGFAVDRFVPPNERRTMFGLPGAGQIEISPDLTKVVVIGGDPKMVNADWNYHNATYFRFEGSKYVIWPSNNAERVWITSDDGKLVQTFLKPPQVERGFAPTDGEFVDGKLHIPSGYADRFIYTADPFSQGANAGEGVWDTFRWGGKGPKKQHGAFSTSHGITRLPHTNVLAVSDREHERVEIFNTLGHYIGGIEFEKGTMPCDIDYDDSGKVAVVGCLKGPGDTTPAPFYIVENGNIVSKVTPGDLGVPDSKHIHNASLRVLVENGKKRWFVLVLFWNPGGYAVFECVEA